MQKQANVPQKSICAPESNPVFLHQILKEMEKTVKTGTWIQGKKANSQKSDFLRSRIRNVARLFFRRILFFPLSLFIQFFNSAKRIIFVRLFHYTMCITCWFEKVDRRKLTAGLYNLHRLLQFTRAVCMPPRQQAAGWLGWKKELHSLCNCRNTGIRRYVFYHNMEKQISADYFRRGFPHNER